MNKTKVFHVITRMIVGGAQENTLYTCQGLARMPDFEVTLISGPTSGPEGSLVDVAKKGPQEFVEMPDLCRPILVMRDFRALRALRHYFQQHCPMIVHTHSGKAGFLGRIAAFHAGVPMIIHGLHGPSFGPFQGWVDNMIFKMAEQMASRYTTHFITVADAMRDQYVAAGIGRPSDYTRVFSGFDLKPYLTYRNDPKVRERYGLSEEDIVIGVIARLFPLKGHDELFRILPQLIQENPKIKVLLVGDGILRPEIEKWRGQMGLQKHLILTGLVRPEEIPHLTAIMDILVHLSHREGLPRALPQAMASGKPVVSFDRDGAGEVCITGKTGFLVPFGDLTGVKEALLNLSKDPELRERLGKNGRMLVKQNFSAEIMVKRTLETYQKVWKAKCEDRSMVSK